MGSSDDRLARIERILADIQATLDVMSVATQKPKKAKSKEVVEVDTSDVVGTLPLNGGGEFEVRQKYFDMLSSLYPAVDIGQEFNGMKGWLEANPSNRKTASGIKRFVNSWVSKRQDQAPRIGNQQQAKTSKQEVKESLSNIHDCSWAD